MTKYYPKFGTFTYKDKNINIKIPLYARKLFIKRHKCPKCNQTWRLRKSDENPTTSIIIYGRRIFQEENGYNPETDKYICPNCKVPVDYIDIPLIKLYAGKCNEYVKAGELLHKYTAYGFNEKCSRWGIEIMAYITDLAELYKLSKELGYDEATAKKKKQTIKLILEKEITQEALDDAWQQYRHRVVARKI